MIRRVLAIVPAMLLGPAMAADAQQPRAHSKVYDFFFKPPPSVMNGVETNASRMARYYELGGGIGPGNGYFGGEPGIGGNDPSYFRTFALPGAGRDPSTYGTGRARMLDRYYGKGQWTLDAQGRAVPAAAPAAPVQAARRPY